MASLPPSATMQASVWSVVFAMLEMTLGTHLSGLLSFLFPQPKPQWLKASSSSSSSSTKTALQERGETQEQLGSAPLALHGTTTIVTGANAGIGFELAKAHFAQGSRVIMACRSAERGRAARQAILNQTRPQTIKSDEQDERVRGPDLVLLMLDTSAKASVRSFVQQWRDATPSDGAKVDFLFLNAGIASPPDREHHFTDEGLEHMYASNFLGHHLLAALLSPMFADDVRVIVTSSAAAVCGVFGERVATQGPGAPSSRADLARYKDELGFHVQPSERLYRLQSHASLRSAVGDMARYGQSKAMQVLFCHILQARFDQSAKRNGVARRKFTASYHPGLVATNIFEPVLAAKSWTNAASRFALNATALSPAQGASAGLWLAHTYDAQPGGFYERTVQLANPWYRSMTDDTAERLWQRWNSDADISEDDWHF